MNPEILITGFGTFPGVPHNPCIDLLNRLRINPPKDVHCTLQRLPVSFRRSITELEEILTIVPFSTPRIHLGCSSKIDRIVLEKQAVNTRDSNLPDVDGVSFKSSSLITPDMQGILQSKVDIESIHQFLQKEGISSSISDDAGKYVCNNLYWASLLNGMASTLFVHVPIVFGDELNQIDDGIRLIINQMLLARNITG